MAVDEMGNYVPTEQQVLGGTVQMANIPSPTDIYSAQNIEQTVTNPVPRPNLDDPLGMYDYYMASPEITQAQQQYQSAFGQLTQAQQTARARRLAIEQNPLESMSNIVGQQARAGQLDALTQQALAENVGVAQSALASLKSTATDKFNIAQQQRSEMTNLIANNPGAGIKYTDSYEDGVKKAETYQTQQRVESIALQYPGAKINKTDDMATVTKKIDDYNRDQEKKAKKEAEEAKKDAYKDSLKQQLQALGSSTKGLSTNELEKKLKKLNKEALAEAKKLSDLKIKQIEADLANTYSLIGERGKGGGLTETEIKTKNENEAFKRMSTLPRGSDNKTNPNNWKPILNDWLEADMSATDFFAKFGQFINENDI